jgi:uncharacterized protein
MIIIHKFDDFLFNLFPATRGKENDIDLLKQELIDYYTQPKGTRQGKVVLVQHREINDTDTGGHFTVKIYESQKEFLPDGTWKHSKIILRPDTNAPGYEPIVLMPESGADLRVIAELVAVLG